MECHRIILVQHIHGRTLHDGWDKTMQLIVTNKGEYLDNPPGQRSVSEAGGAAPGYDWAARVGDSVEGVMVFEDFGYRWLNKQ